MDYGLNSPLDRQLSLIVLYLWSADTTKEGPLKKMISDHDKPKSERSENKHYVQAAQALTVLLSYDAAPSEYLLCNTKRINQCVHYFLFDRLTLPKAKLLWATAFWLKDQAILSEDTMTVCNDLRTLCTCLVYEA